MKRVTIYIDEEVWSQIQRAAHEATVFDGHRVSYGRYIADLFKSRDGVDELKEDVDIPPVHARFKKNAPFKSYSKESQLNKGKK